MDRVLSFPRKRESKVRVSLWTPAFAGVTIAERRSLLFHTLASGNLAQIPNALWSAAGVVQRAFPKDARLPTGYGPHLQRPIRRDYDLLQESGCPLFAGIQIMAAADCWLESAAVPCSGPQ
jgi:hypothetical protein